MHGQLHAIRSTKLTVAILLTLQEQVFINFSTKKCSIEMSKVKNIVLKIFVFNVFYFRNMYYHNTSPCLLLIFKNPCGIIDLIKVGEILQYDSCVKTLPNLKIKSQVVNDLFTHINFSTTNI